MLRYRYLLIQYPLQTNFKRLPKLLFLSKYCAVGVSSRPKKVHERVKLSSDKSTVEDTKECEHFFVFIQN
jgi:hypothetical protein